MGMILGSVSGQRCGEMGKGCPDAGYGGITGQKGVWTAEPVTFLHTVLEMANQGQLERPFG